MHHSHNNHIEQMADAERFILTPLAPYLEIAQHSFVYFFFSFFFFFFPLGFLSFFLSFFFPSFSLFLLFFLSFFLSFFISFIHWTRAVVIPRFHEKALPELYKLFGEGKTLEEITEIMGQRYGQDFAKEMKKGIQEKLQEKGQEWHDIAKLRR